MTRALPTLALACCLTCLPFRLAGSYLASGGYRTNKMAPSLAKHSKINRTVSNTQCSGYQADHNTSSAPL